MGKDVLTTLDHLSSDPSIEVHCRLGNVAETKAARALLEKAEDIVVDEMTLATLLICGVHEHLAKSPKRLIVSEGTLLSIENWDVMRIDPNSRGGSVGIVDGRLTLSEMTREGVERTQEGIRRLVGIVKEHCAIESGVPLSRMGSEKRDTLVKVVGRACAESMALASSGQRVLWTDDLGTSLLLTNEFGAGRVWTQLVFEHFAQHGSVDPQAVSELSLNLNSLGYWFTSLNARIAQAAIVKSNWDVEKSPLKEVLGHFGDRRVTLDANLLLMAGKGVKYSWSNDRRVMKAPDVTYRILEQLGQRGDPVLLASTLWMLLEGLLAADVGRAQFVSKIIENWLGPRGLCQARKTALLWPNPAGRRMNRMGE